VDRLPLLISVPHAGVEVPKEVRDICALTNEDIIADSDEGAQEIYDLKDIVFSYVTTEVPRAIIDVNRSEDDRSEDGVVKTHTIWNVPVYKRPLEEKIIREMIQKYYRPYHERLTALSKNDVMFGIDCHTMAAEAPPIDPHPGTKRPDICLSNADGTCSRDILDLLKDCIEEAFGREISLNDPFTGGHIIRAHSDELPWVQFEITRRNFMMLQEKKECVLKAFRKLYKRIQIT
jgi:formiminoglutamase